MVLEHALLRVDPDDAQAFESAFGRARTVVAQAAGFQGLELWRSVEQPGDYRLLIRWGSVEDHTIGFRGSELYEEWSRLLRSFYTAPPEVDHGELAGEVR